MSQMEQTLSSLRRFIYLCLERGKKIEQARDALLTANLEPDLVNRAVRSILEERQGQEEISLDFEDVDEPELTPAPSLAQAKTQPKVSVRRTVKTEERIELVRNTPQRSRRSNYRRPKVKVAGFSVGYTRLVLTRYLSKWLVAGAVAVALLFVTPSSKDASVTRAPASVGQKEKPQNEVGDKIRRLTSTRP